MSDFEPVEPGPVFQADWAKWQKQLREWRQAYDEWRQVLQQLQEWDEKESKGIQLPSIDPNFDVFGVENILDIGEGEPLFGNFEYEDWLLLSTRVELHLLVHHFRDDTGGAVLDGSNLAHYYKCYFKKSFKPEDFAVKSAEEVILLVQDSVCIENSLLEHKLPENTSWLHFLKMTEQFRRERMQALEAGDETVSLAFPGAAKQREAARKKQAAKEAELAEAGREELRPLERQSRPRMAKRPLRDSSQGPAKAARTDDRRGDRDRDRYGETPRQRSTFGARDERGRDPRERSERERGRYPDRLPERNGYNPQRSADRSRHTEPDSQAHGVTGSRISGSQPQHEHGYGTDRPASRSLDWTPSSGRREPPASSYGRELQGKEAVRRREAPQTAYRRDQADLPPTSHSKPPAPPQASGQLGREPARPIGAVPHGRETREGPAPPGRGAAASHGRGPSKGSWRQKDLDPLDAFMAGMERHGEAFAKGDLPADPPRPAEPPRPPKPPPAPPRSSRRHYADDGYRDSQARSDTGHRDYRGDADYRGESRPVDYEHHRGYTDAPRTGYSTAAATSRPSEQWSAHGVIRAYGSAEPRNSEYGEADRSNHGFQASHGYHRTADLDHRTETGHRAIAFDYGQSSSFNHSDGRGYSGRVNPQDL